MRRFCIEIFRVGVVEYRQHFPHPRTPHRKTFETVRTIMRKPGSFPRAKAEREQQRRAGGDALAAVQRSLGISIPRISRTTGVAQAEAREISQHNVL